VLSIGLSTSGSSMPAERQQVWLVRHGATEWSLQGRHTGRSDIPLEDSGRRQAAGLGTTLARHTFVLVLASPLGRAAETARLAGVARAQLDPDLMEWDYGEYDGLTTPQIRQRDPDWSLWRSGGPGGEDPAEAGRRADRVVARLRQATGDVLVFSHGHFLRVLTARWLGLEPSTGRYFYLGTAGVGVLGYEHDKPVVRAWNLSADGGPA
jgi:broad specificity phosphatase PhoE